MIFQRTEMLLGAKAMQRLNNAHVAVFGIGGVGSYVAEALCRSGIGSLTLVDDDAVSITNLNRQLIALHSTVGRPKTTVMKERIHDINPQAQVFDCQCFFTAETADQFNFSQYNFIADCIDTVSSKLLLIERAYACGTPVISSMGAGNKLHPELFELSDIYETSVCPLARVMRHELKARNIPTLPVVYSKEKPIKPTSPQGEDASAHVKRQPPGSTAFVPSAAGLILAGEIIRRLAGLSDNA